MGQALHVLDFIFCKKVFHTILSESQVSYDLKKIGCVYVVLDSQSSPQRNCPSRLLHSPCRRISISCLQDIQSLKHTVYVVNYIDCTHRSDTHLLRGPWRSVCAIMSYLQLLDYV